MLWRGLTFGRDNKALLMARSGKMLNANELACRLFARPLTDIVGLPVSELISDPPQACSRWKTSLTTPAGHTVPVEITHESIGAGTDDIVVYAIRDLRERREAERQRQLQTVALQEREKELSIQRRNFEMALTSLSQGLCVFDAGERLVICNQPYREMYRLEAHEARPGTPLRDILRIRAERGACSAEAIQERLGIVAAHEPSTITQALADGRIVEVGHHPMPGGGWVATHLDVTSQRRLEDQLRQQNRQLEEHERQLDAALENLTQGLCMFDNQGRLVLRNEQYLRMYGLSPDQAPAGLPIRELLRRRLNCGTFPKGPSPDAYLADMYASLELRSEWSRVTELEDGRFIVVANRTMPGGGWVATHQDVTELHKAERGLVVARGAAEAAAREARAAHSTLLDAFEVVPEGLVLFDADDRYVLWNARYAELCTTRIRRGMRFEEMVRSEIRLGRYPDTRGREEEWIAERLARHRQPHNSQEMQLDDGRWVRIHEHRTANGGSIGVRIDITELKKRNMMLDAALDNMSQGLVLFDANRRVLVCNRRYREIYGLTEEQVKPGTPTSQLIEYRLALGLKVQSEPSEYIRSRIDRPVTASNALQEFADGRTIAYAIRPLPDGGGVATHEDVTAQRRIEARIAHMAHYDGLTDLPNRALLRQRLEEALQRAGGGQSIAVLWLDLDRFKEVNDTLGHPVGDALLKIAAERLRTCIGRGDTVARLGGDEFAIVQPDADQPVAATALALRVIEEVGQPCQIDGHRVVVGASVGIALYPNDGYEPDQLLKNADLALYRAKTAGRGVYRFFEPEMDARMHARRQLELDLREALAEGAFQLHYQPIVDLDTGRIRTLEALLRWDHPVRGRVSPGEFIPLAEETGLISPLGEWVMRTACAEAASWPEDIRVAVNLSPLQFSQGDLVQLVFNALAVSGLAPSRLELEITESVLLENTDRILAMLHRLKDLGVHISMDDFGTGYSSLKNLRSFPFDKIKIDQSFIQDLGKDQQCLVIVQAIAALGAGLAMTTTAEGVETRDQLDWVRLLGIAEVQGYYLSQPMPLADIQKALPEILRRSRIAA